MTNNSKNRREGFKVVVQDRWSLNSSGRYNDFDCIKFQGHPSLGSREEDF